MRAALSPYSDTVYSTGPLKDLRWRMVLSGVFLNSEHCCLVLSCQGDVSVPVSEWQYCCPMCSGPPGELLVRVQLTRTVIPWFVIG